MRDPMFEPCAARRHRKSVWRVCFCKDPATLAGPAVVFFPIRDHVLCCGLAGFVCIKRPAPMTDDCITDRFAEAIDAVCTAGIASLASGTIEKSAYLSPASLEVLSGKIYLLKQDANLQHVLCCGSGLGRLRDHSERLKTFVEMEDAALEKEARSFPSGDLEAFAARLTTLKDISWSLREDIIRNHDKILALAGPAIFDNQGYYGRYLKINACLNALDRLEVRGRDSAGLQVMVQLDGSSSVTALRHTLTQKGLFEDLLARCRPADLMDGSIHFCGNTLTFTYKTAQITGELGENTARLRKHIGGDQILREVLSIDNASEVYLTHTRWASVGAINEINCHPVNSHTVDVPSSEEYGVPVVLKEYPLYGKGAWTISAALNGDIDNYHAIKDAIEQGRRMTNPDVTTDTKAIPLQIEHYLYEGHDLRESFRRAVNDFEGSHAIAMESNLEPGRIFLAQKGSGQTIYVGLLDNGYMFASEVYGLVEETPRFIKMDGETMRVPGDPSTQGQLFILRNDRGTGLDGIEAMSYDGQPLILSEGDINQAQITTRDIDRGEHQHFLIKEILDAPSSIRKTLRGKYRIVGGGEVVFNLDEGVVDARTRSDLAAGRIRNIYVVGQGTAAVAASAVAEAVSAYLRSAPVNVQARKATDLSGFLLDEDMSDTIVIAITQSGTTTDTNRAVTMARQRGARLIAIVNRRQSDITTKVDGVFYTSDGRDIEMSVASTKAFYSQIVAGYVLALFFAQVLRTLPGETIARDLKNLEEAPDLMQGVIGRREAIRATAWNVVRRKQYWAVVGSGINKVASDEIRIKLSELCYKTISSDIIEDKKHIDLSSEPLILVCAAGSPEIVLDDIVKDVAIFKAHAASVVVITDEGEHRFDTVSDDVIHVPHAGFPLSVIFNTLAGHIWGYYAACSLDAMARSMKGFRSSLAEIAKEHRKKEYTVYESIEDKELHRIVDGFGADFKTWKGRGELASLSIGVASDITLLLKYVKGKLPVEDFWLEFEDKRVSSSPIDMLDLTLKRAVEELSRPIDAIRHQAKTVTVGTSRKAQVPSGPVFAVFDELGYTPESVRAKDVMTLKKLQGAVSRVKGYTLYEVNGLDEEGMPTEESTLSIVKRQGVSSGMRSRYDSPAPLKGTKNTIVRTRKVYAGTGRSDNASIIVIPIQGPRRIITHLLLLQVDFNEDIGTARKKEIMGVKINDITNLINEYDIPWKDEYLEGLSVKFLLGEDVEVIKNTIMRSLEERRG
ncbi:MAG TPA: SIS domain-containing protein [Deltaproteobacteria bacterium]|nr:SIS domain-containing protein [Deltaproteobacteria bacterium]HPR54483.1 SIS domain-containing protein [Deltaproteobacteria bacterium]HXK46591.1 SIS domain-containing protein [Deltaproteobacteria bacterium]